jgi:hypothetical protein
VVTETQVEGTAIPEAVAIGGVVPKAGVPKGTTLGPEVQITKEMHEDALPEPSMDVVVRSPEIQDAEQIRSTLMSGMAMTSRGGLELLSDDLINPVMVARNLESMRWAEQWMKARGSTFE